MFRILIILCLFFATPVFAAPDDIDKTEVRPDTTIYKIDTVTLQAFTETAIVTYRKGYMDDEVFVHNGEYERVLFINNEATPTGFNQFITYIQNRIAAGDTLKLAITKACKIKLGL